MSHTCERHGNPLHRPRTAAWTPDQCRYCWLLQKSPPGRCPALGEATGGTAPCKTCTGRVELKLFACAVFGTCTIARKVEGRGCCQGCDSRPPVT